MTRWLPFAVGTGVLLAACTDSRGPTQPALRGAPNFEQTGQRGPRTHIMVPHGQSKGRGHQKGGNSGIFYHGGPVILSQNVVAIYWSASTIYQGGPVPASTGDGSADGSLVGFFLRNLGGSPYFNINTTYTDATGAAIQNVVNYTKYWASADNAPPPGSAPGDADMQALIEAGFAGGQLTYDPSTSYLVFTGPGVNLGGGFGSIYCAYHGYFIDGSGRNVKFAAMPYAWDFPGGCSGFSGNGPNATDPAADAVVNVAAHEIEETTTDENLDAWYDAVGNENADKCVWQFGTTYAVNGSDANMNLGGKDFLIQMNWVNAVVNKLPAGCHQAWP